MDEQRMGREAEAREVEQIMRAAEAKGHDPERVARALDYRGRQAPAQQLTSEPKRLPVLARLLGGGLIRGR